MSDKLIIAKTESEVREIISQARKNGKTIGFVPTMGALHEGHLSLVKRSNAETGFTVVSIFVNPSQFGPNEDFKKYPRDLEKDRSFLEKTVDLLFYPDVSEIYPEGFSTWVKPGKPARILEGKRRPGHFQGVCTVVLKLFEIVRPDIAYFGQKDAQQFVVLDRMVKDFNMPIKMIECPIIREKDGLAMSSRNAYLNKDERSVAVIYSKALQEALKLIESGERKAAAVIELIRKTVENEPLARLDYAEIVDSVYFKKIKNLRGTVYILITGFLGTTRLIDNIKVSID
jgi:pantoate--beta-alanine ligase